MKQYRIQALWETSSQGLFVIERELQSHRCTNADLALDADRASMLFDQPLDRVSFVPVTGTRSCNPPL